jgi:hypothetical protein
MMPILCCSECAGPVSVTTGNHRRRIAEHFRSAGAGVESVVAVDFRNRMTDGVLKQQC